MKILSLITEYNPLHNGHIYHIETAKKLISPDVTIVIMSGNYTQRGELAVIDKFTRAREAIKYVDLIVELPELNAISFADDFARGAIEVLKRLGTTDIVFGSESADINQLKHAYLKSKAIKNEDLKPLLSEGKSYPRAMRELTGEDVFNSPNNTLGISYLKAIDELAPHINAHTIKRMENSYIDKELSEGRFSSATSLRNTLDRGNLETAEKYMPGSLARRIAKNGVKNNEHIFQALKIIIERATPQELSEIYTMTEGLEYRLKKYIHSAKTYEQYISLIKTKRYTRTRLQRLLLYVLLNLKTEDYINHSIDGIRVLAMNKIGQQYISTIKNETLVTNVTKKDADHFKYEIKGTRIYNMLTNNNANEFNQPVIIHRYV